MRNKMNAKSIGIITSCLGGLIAAFAVKHWPLEAGFIQMGFLSVLVLTGILAYLWTQRTKSTIAFPVCAVIALHLAAVFTLQSYFPFQTILPIVFIALIEGFMLLGIAIKLL